MCSIVCHLAYILTLFIPTSTFIYTHTYSTQRRYNFYLFPPSNDDTMTREVTMNPSSIAFLNQHGMDFNLWTRQGISYVTTKQAETLVNKYKEETIKENKTTTPPAARDPTRRRIVLTKQEDINFHARAMASLREWIDGSIRGQPSLLLPACNRFLRRALYESLELEYPALILENGGPLHENQIRVWRLSTEEKQVRKVKLQKEAWEKTIQNVGFQRVFQALSLANQGYKTQTNSVLFANSVQDVDVNAEPTLEPLGRRIPIICHNGLMDLLFLLTHFHSHELPSSYIETKALIHTTFPLVYDTKILATECTDPAVIGDSTILGTLYTKFVEQDDILDRNFQVVNASSGGLHVDRAHEASYDAFMTGALFVALARRILANQNKSLVSLHDMLFLPEYEPFTREFFGRNKVNECERCCLCSVAFTCVDRATFCHTSFSSSISSSSHHQLYLMLTLYTIDLENPTSDPLRHGLSPSSTFRVSGIDPAIHNGDIIRSLSGVVDNDRPVRFEIVWVDSTTFMVATRSQDGQATLQRHGSLLEHALRRRFVQEDICTLQEYLDATTKRQVDQEQDTIQKGEESTSMWSKFLGMFGYGSKRKASEDWDGTDDEPQAKRRRTSS